MLEAAKTAEQRGWEMAIAETKIKTALLAENGINVAQPTEKLKKDLKAVGSKMVDEWLEEAGSEGLEIIQDYKK